jgi:nickel superoxide dismutase
MKIGFFFSVLPEKIAYAHCDIPCGIYDPHVAQMAAHTVLRMTQLLSEAKVPTGENVDSLEYTKHHNTVVRQVTVKEHHGNLVEAELATLKHDYFKHEHHEQFPDLKQLIKDSVKLSAETRQGIDLEKAKLLLEKVLLISEVFYKTKNVTPVRIKSLYPTEGEIVIYK